jgi:hypothetical protein
VRERSVLSDDASGREGARSPAKRPCGLRRSGQDEASGREGAWGKAKEASGRSRQR